MTEEAVRKKVEKVSSRERVKSNVDKEIGDRIREFLSREAPLLFHYNNLPGIR